MKVSEAEELICPFMVDCTFKLDGSIKTIYKKCIADKCMAWGWNMEEELLDKHLRIGKTLKYKSTTNGYCKRLKL